MRTIPASGTDGSDVSRRARQHYDALSVDEKAAAVCRMIDDGFTDDVVAQASGLSREMVMEIISKRATSR
jgi:ParB-like chromosome segregation protein Spo0J